MLENFSNKNGYLNIVAVLDFPHSQQFLYSPAMFVEARLQKLKIFVLTTLTMHIWKFQCMANASCVKKIFVFIIMYVCKCSVHVFPSPTMCV